jgi:competence protein ComEA
MPTPLPQSPLHLLRQSLVARVLALARASPWRTAGAALGVVAVAALVWWALRPPTTIPVESTLPRVTVPLPSTAGGSGAGSSVATVGSGSSGTSPSGSGAPGVSSPDTAGSVVVHVAGAVNRPGLVALPAGSRVADAVAAAGGSTLDADLERVNLAAKVTDGQRVLVPRAGEPAATEATGSSAGANPTGGVAPSGPIDLNTATAIELDALPGVGPATAAAIVTYRDQHGKYTSIDALLDVPGIGPAKLAQIRVLVQV